MDSSNLDGIGTCRHPLVNFNGNALQVDSYEDVTMHLATDRRTMTLWDYSHGNGKMHLATSHRAMGSMDMRTHIHRLELEAYHAVLRAFTAQSDVLSWGKEGLISELRKELNITDLEHRRLLLEIDSDESFRKLSEWRKGVFCAQGSFSGKGNVVGLLHSSVGTAPQKILNSSYAEVPASYKYVSQGPPSLATPLSSPAHFKDCQQSRQLPIFVIKNPVQSTKVIINDIPAPHVGKYGRSVKALPKRTFRGDHVSKFSKRSDIEIPATDKLVHQVEMMIYGRESPGPIQLERAMSILIEQERALLEALTEIEDVSNHDDFTKQSHRRYSNEGMLRTEQGRKMHKDIHGRVNRRASFSEIVSHDDERTMPRFHL